MIFIIGLLSFILNPQFIFCNQINHKHHKHHISPSITYNLNTNFHYNNPHQNFLDQNSQESNLAHPTPQLNNIASFNENKISQLKNVKQLNGYIKKRSHSSNYIQPAKIQENAYFTYEPIDRILFSPIFNVYQSEYPFSYMHQQQLPLQSYPDNSNAFDMIESGSGQGSVWENIQLSEEISNLTSDTTNSEIEPTPKMTPTFGGLQTAQPPGSMEFNRPPVLNRRLPRLMAVAGQVWKYFIPFDTFYDEDGDLRQLKSTVQFRLSSSHTNDESNTHNMKLDNTSFEDIGLPVVGQYNSWLQYDSNYQLIYGFPTVNNAGKHELTLEVSDRWGLSSVETFEIYVKQHQSSRAFTHQYTINNIEWNQERFPFLIDALSEIVKRVSTKVYFDQPFKNMIVQYYLSSNNNVVENIAPNKEKNLSTNEDEYTPTNPTSAQKEQNPNLASTSIISYTVAWSNSSIPIHPCNLSVLDDLTKQVIDFQALPVDWSLDKGNKFDLPTSPNLMRALGSDFKPGSVNVHLEGACEGIDSTGLLQSNLVNAELNLNTISPRVRIKIGKLTWKLGEPIEYRIPDETFESDSGVSTTTKDFELSLHTIDGLSFDKDIKYNFLEFDEETQTLYGLPYDLKEHAGQKELQITARHPKSGLKSREVFIINIEAQDLTTLNNRAFRISLYLAPRAGIFNPRERVLLSRKIIEALHIGESTSIRASQSYPELIVIDIQKFTIANLNNSYLSSAPLDTEEYQDKIIRVLDASNDISNNQIEEYHASRETSSQNSQFYKFTWTNGTIGYRGDCPVEVLRENILYALEQSMVEFKINGNNLIDDEDPTKDDSDRFYNRLRRYFEPESDLLHLRFEPLGACVSALNLHDVGNNDLADQADRAGDLPVELNLDSLTTPGTLLTTTPAQDLDTLNDEYWSVVVLIVLVVALIFVIIMFFMGMHTYKMNQDKRFELQVRLAQARQNSMYLSSMILANQAVGGLSDQCAKPMYVVQDEEKSSRKPVILDNEKQLLNINSPVAFKPTTARLSGQTVQTTSLQPNMTFTLDSVVSNGWQSQQHSNQISFQDEKYRSMTLHRRPSNLMQRQVVNHQTLMNNMNHSQSILTVASLAGPLPMVYTPMSMVEQPPQHNFSSLQRRFSRDLPQESNNGHEKQ